MCNHRRYGFSNFVGDLILICFTFGLWIIWICIREAGRSRCGCCC